MKENTSIVRSDYYDESDTYARSNFMISSKYKSTLFSNRLMAISLSRLGSAKESDEGYLSVSVKGTDIQSLFGVKGHSFFSQLANTAQGMTGQTIGWSNPVTQEFEYIAAVTRATYTDGEFTIEFHKGLKKYLTDLTQNYTKFSLEVMLSFKSTYSFRLYELLKSRCFYRKGEERDNNRFKIEFDINELRLDLGVVNAELESVRRILSKTKGKPDYAKAVEASPEKLFATWGDFRKNVIEVAVKEINSKPETGIHIDGYETLKSGRGGKVHAVVFFVENLGNKRQPKRDVVEAASENHDDMTDDIKDLISDIRSREARAIGEAAGWDMGKIERNYEYSQGRDVDDIVAYMIKAVKEDYAKSPKKGRKKDTMHFGNERKYSKEFYEEILDAVN
ncbi:MAG: replication initiation protein [Lachnospiraceae bacterium]|nr:replication initiation protein [Lachnospiraceae bacterium]